VSVALLSRLNRSGFPYKSKSGEDYILNLIDTPGHVDFNYEVSRSLKACEGAIFTRRFNAGSRGADHRQRLSGDRCRPRIIPVINKIDLPNAMIEDTRMQIEDMLGLPAEDACWCPVKPVPAYPSFWNL